MEPSDEVLCERVARRDEDAFDLLVGRYQQRAWRLAWSFLRDAEEARDVTQEAFVRVYRAAASFNGRARFSTWFYRILVNLCLEHRRRRRWWRLGAPADGPGNGTPPIEEQPASASHPLDGLEREQMMRRLWAAVDTLSPQQRAVVGLTLEDVPTPEIAAVLGCAEATVRVHLHRALQALRDRVTP